jgi:small subunit ribosomal protein S11
MSAFLLNKTKVTKKFTNNSKLKLKKFFPKFSSKFKKSQFIQPKIFIQGIIHIKSTLNNTIVTLTDLLGNTKACVSCGSIGFKGSKRSSRFAGQAAAEQLGIKAKTLGYKKIILHLNGFGKGRNVCVKGLKKSGLQIYFIKDFTTVAYNGCRSPKVRRL